MVNFGPLAAEIGLPVWGTPANFNDFRVLAALLHGSQVEREPNFVVLNRGHLLCSAGRPSGWAVAHISSLICCQVLQVEYTECKRSQDTFTHIFTKCLLIFKILSQADSLVNFQ